MEGCGCNDGCFMLFETMTLTPERQQYPFASDQTVESTLYSKKNKNSFTGRLWTPLNDGGVN